MIFTMDAFSSPRLVIRPALPRDKQQVLEFCRTIWEGEDYIRYVWDEWFADPDGWMFTAEYAAQVVGLGRLARLAPDQWWLEGLRVDPRYHGRGIGSRLNDHLFEYWRVKGSGVLRLMTTSERPQVLHLCERGGFSRVGDFCFFIACSLDESIETFHAVQPEEVAEATQRVQEADTLRLSYGLMDLGWRFVTPNAHSLLKAVEKNRLYWWRKREGVLCVWDDEDPGGVRVLLISQAACAEAHLVDLLMDFRRLANKLGYLKTTWIAPLHPDLFPILEAAGFQRDWDQALWVFDKT